jgi:hypothetical protein
LPFERRRLHLLLRVGLEFAGLLGLPAHALHGRHHVSLLRQKRVAQLSGPLQVLI